MARRRYLVAYDIRDDRPPAGHRHLHGGIRPRIQYSVFVCDLSSHELVLMRSDIEARMKVTEDSVMVVDLGRPGDPGRFPFLGHHEKLPTTDAVIV